MLDDSTDFSGKTWTSAPVAPGQAAIGAGSRGFRYGDGVFVTLGIRAGILLDAELQFDRLRAAATAIGLAPPRLFGDREQAPWRLAAILEHLGAVDTGTARLQWSAPAGARGFGRDDVMAEAIVDLLPPPVPRRPSVAVLDEEQAPLPALPHFKTCSALGHVLCERAAADRGADTGIRTRGGLLLEAGSANLFWLRGARLYTPDAALPLYAGSVRERVVESALAAGLPLEEGAWPREALEDADALLLTNAARGIEFAASIDDRSLPEPSTVALALTEAVAARREAAGIVLGGPGAAA